MRASCPIYWAWRRTLTSEGTRGVVAMLNPDTATVARSPTTETASSAVATTPAFSDERPDHPTHRVGTSLVSPSRRASVTAGAPPILSLERANRL